MRSIGGHFVVFAHINFVMECQHVVSEGKKSNLNPDPLKNWPVAFGSCAGRKELQVQQKN